VIPDSDSEVPSWGRSFVLQSVVSVSASEVSCAESELSNEDSESASVPVGSAVGGVCFHLRKMVLIQHDTARMRITPRKRRYKAYGSALLLHDSWLQNGPIRISL
jgi:hypothetical protein